MAKKTFDKVMRHIRLVAAVHAYRGLADRELLEHFTQGGDEAAFTVIIDRHGPMLLGVCRRALGNLHDAEDVCQATFLVLARKAASIRKSTSLSSWLHGVACRGAASFTRARARRERRERETEPTLVKDAAAEVSWREIQSILDDELEQLPQRYRAPLILCYLNGKTRDEAAQQLGLTSATLHGRLERGRNLLRERLTRRGLTLSAALFATALGDSALRAALPASFVVSSAKAAMALVAGQTAAEGVISATVLTLTREVLKTMFLAKLKIGSAAVICASLIATVTCGALTSLGVAQDVKPEAAKGAATPATKGESDEDFIRRMSRDLRGNEPTPTEIHFFAANRDSGKRQKLVDLFIQERQKQQIDRYKNVAMLLVGAEEKVKKQRVAALKQLAEALRTGDPAVLAAKQRASYEEYFFLKREKQVLELEIHRTEALLSALRKDQNGEPPDMAKRQRDSAIAQAEEKLKIMREQSAVVAAQIAEALKKADEFAKASREIELRRQEIGEIDDVLRQLRKQKGQEADSNSFEGTLLPIKRTVLYAPVEGFIVKTREGLKSGSPVVKGEELLVMRDTDLAGKIFQLQSEIAAAQATLNRAANRQNKDDSDQTFIKELNEAQVFMNQKSQLLEDLRKRTNSTNTPGEFRVLSPLAGIVLTADFQEKLLPRNVKPNEPLLSVGSTDVNNPKLSDWEIELKIPQKHLGEVLRAFSNKDPKEELDVDFIPSSLPTRTFKGKLLKSKIASQTLVNGEANNKADHVLWAFVRISGSDIPEEYRLTTELLLTGTEIRARIRSRSGAK